MRFMTGRWNVAILLVLSLLLTGLACVGDLRAQLRKDEVDFEYMDVVTVDDPSGYLWNLAKKYYNDPLQWEYIMKMNKIPNERRISKGTVVYIPVKDAKKIVKAVEAEIEEKKVVEKDLSAELEMLRAELRDLKEKAEDCAEKNKRLAKALEEKDAMLAEKEAAIRDLQAMLDNLKGAADRAKAEAVLEAQRAKLRAEAAEAKFEAEVREVKSDQRRHIEELESQLDRCRREREKLEMARDELMAKIKRAEMAEERPMKAEKPERPLRKADNRSMVAAVAIALVGSIIWIASD